MTYNFHQLSFYKIYLLQLWLLKSLKSNNGVQNFGKKAHVWIKEPEAL